MTTTLAEIATVVVEIGGTHSPVGRHLHFLRAMAINFREFLSVSRLPTGERAYQAFHGGTSATSSSVQTVICLERSLDHFSRLNTYHTEQAHGQANYGGVIAPLLSIKEPTRHVSLFACTPCHSAVSSIEMASDVRGTSVSKASIPYCGCYQNPVFEIHELYYNTWHVSESDITIVAVPCLPLPFPTPRT